MNKEHEKIIDWLTKKINSKIEFDNCPTNEAGWHEIKRESVVDILNGLIPMLKTAKKNELVIPDVVRAVCEYQLSHEAFKNFDELNYCPMCGEKL